MPRQADLAGALRTITAKWERGAPTWRQAMNQFAILYGDHFIPPTTKMPMTRVDAAVPVDGQTALPGTWNTAQNANLEPSEPLEPLNPEP